MIESAADSAHADNRCRLDAIDRGAKIPRRRVLVRIRLLEIEEICAGGLQEAVDVEHIDVRLRFPERHPLLNERGTEQVGETDAGRTRAEEEVFFILQL